VPMSDTVESDLTDGSLERADGRAGRAAMEVRHVPTHSRGALAIKRAFDAVCAVVGLVVFIPVLVVVGIAVRLTSRGPVIFRQDRVGRDGTTFTLYKFRTMRDGTDLELLADDEARRRYEANNFKLASDDPRITRVGRVLRRTSLDELPQLVNVLHGDMSIVGIRPLLQPELERRSDHARACYRVMRPGLTGLWQVEGRSRLVHEDRQALDCLYVEQWSLTSDLQILLRTPGAVLKMQHAR